MAYAPLAPTVYFEPLEIAPDTFLIQQVQPACGQPLFVYLNSLVIRAQEPVIVDTGTPANRAQWLEDVFSLVEPADVRWIYLSHDDVDHSGNLEQVMDACPNATLVCSWPIVERHTNCFDFPLERCRWVNDGESFDAGDRVLAALQPPYFDSPTTRGLYDPKTKVYWAIDSFATPVADVPHQELDEIDEEFWHFGMSLFALGGVSPWLSWVDPAKFGAHVDRVQSLDITTIAACHTPVLRGTRIDDAFAFARGLAGADLPDLPDQSVLDQIVAATAQPVG
ncbi:MAG TPA: MBL fold metallo-hydrolase [Acidimicrobiia bacterium]|nr:MBL fold metallo-hydrolase [Acidimicrobiia bacterium]